MARLLRAGFGRLYTADAAAGRAALPRAFDALLRMLGGAGEGAAQDCAEAMKALARDCIDAVSVAEAVRAAAAAAHGAGGGRPPPLALCAASLESALGVRYQAAWPAALPVAAVMFERLGPAAGVVLAGTLTAMGEMAAAPGLSCRPALLLALGAALRHAGPERVMQVLPVDCSAAVAAAGGSRRAGGAARRRAAAAAAAARDGDAMEEDQDQEGEEEELGSAGNVWMLPLLAKHVRGARLQFWGRALLPQAKEMAVAAAAARQGGRAREAAAAAGLEGAVWAALPAFATLAVDVSSAFPALARELGAALTNSPELRAAVLSTLAALLGSGDGRGDGDGGAAESRACCASYAKNFLPILFNLFVAAPGDRRGGLAAAIGGLAGAADATTVAGFFRTVVKKLIKVTSDAEGAPDGLLEGGDSRSARRGTFMDLLLALGPGLDAEGLAVLQRLALPAIGEADAQVQKKGYKLLAWLQERRAELSDGDAAEVSAEAQEKADAELVAALQSALPVCVPAARHHRHRLVAALLPRLGSRAALQAATAPLLAELILGTKEANSKTRAGAYELLVALARRLEAVAAAQGRPGQGALSLFNQACSSAQISVLSRSNHTALLTALLTALRTA